MIGHLYRRMIHRLYCHGVRWFLSQRFPGEAMHGPGWAGFAIGADKGDALEVAKCVTALFPDVQESVAGDFACKKRTPGKLFVIHVGAEYSVDDVCNLLLAKAGMGLRHVAGRYLQAGETALISGCAGSAELQICVAHEICHFVCHDMFGAVGTIPWASEGYANVVTGRIICHTSDSSLLRAYAAQVEAAVRWGSMGLRQILSREEHDNNAEEEQIYESFVAHATLFVDYLFNCARKSLAIENVLKQAIREDISTVEVLSQLERAFGSSIEVIEERFHVYCAAVARPPY